MIKCKKLTISDDHIIQPYKSGVRLVHPAKEYDHVNHDSSVSTIMKMPINFYFMDSSSQIVKLNESTAKTCGYISTHNAIGKSIRDISKKDTAEKILKNDADILDHERWSIVTETFTKLDDQPLKAVSIKFPWYQNQKLVGIFGCSILLDAGMEHNLPIFVSDKIKLSQQYYCNYENIRRIDNVNLNENESTILHFLIRGHTAKTIAKQLNRSYRTIEHTLAELKLKLNVSTKQELISKVINHLSDIKGI